MMCTMFLVYKIDILNVSVEYDACLVVAETQIINQKISPETFHIDK